MEPKKSGFWKYAGTFWSILMFTQIILGFCLYNTQNVDWLLFLGWAIFFVASYFGLQPVITLRKKGAVQKEKGFLNTTVLVQDEIYGIVRHPQFLGGILLNFALIFIVQHWLITLLGLLTITLMYGITLKADENLVVKFGDDYKSYMERVPRLNLISGLWRILTGKNKQS